MTRLSRPLPAAALLGTLLGTMTVPALAQTYAAGHVTATPLPPPAAATPTPAESAEPTPDPKAERKPLAARK